MSVTTADLIRLLDDSGVRHLPDLDGAIPCLVGEGDSTIMVTVTAANEGGMIQFRTVNLLVAKGPHYRRTLLTALVNGSNRYKLVKFGWDPEDGEVVAYIDVFVGDGRLTKKQFSRCVNTLRSVVIRVQRRCQQIVATGQDPGDPGAGPGELLGLLQQMFEAKAKGEGKSSGPAASEGRAKKKGKAPKGNLDDLFNDLLQGPSG